MRDRIRTYSAALVLASAAFVYAADRRAALDSLIEAERSFSRASVSKGTRAAFLEFLDERSIVFRPGPSPGRKTYEAQPESKTTLSWSPIFADVAISGDFGYTTGPWTVSEDKQGARPIAHGHYMSVWKKDAAGAWRVMIDLGISHASPGKTTAEVATPPPAEAPPPKKRAEEQASLVGADGMFSAAASSKGFAAAFREYAAPDVKLYRNNQLPFTTETEVRKALESLSAPSAWQAKGVEIAASADLGYTYGVLRESGGKTETGAYCRVWKKQPNGAWRVVVDVERPFPPPKR